MAHPYGQEFNIVSGSSPFLCDICTSPIDSKHIATSVGGVGQSAVCWETAEAIYKLVAGERAKAARAARIPAETRLRVEAVLPQERV